MKIHKIILTLRLKQFEKLDIQVEGELKDILTYYKESLKLTEQFTNPNYELDKQASPTYINLVNKKYGTNFKKGIEKQELFNYVFNNSPLEVKNEK